MPDDASAKTQTSSPGAFFGRIATTYGSGRYFKIRQEAVIRAIAPELRSARTILDLGCGNGGYLAEFLQAASQATLIGADLSIEMLLEARRRCGNTPRLCRADQCALPFTANTFDLVFCSHVLIFSSDFDLTIREIARVLKPGGELVATLGAPGEMRGEVRKVLSPSQWDVLQNHAFARMQNIAGGVPPPERYYQAYNSAGLKPDERLAPFGLTGADVEEWIRFQALRLGSDDASRAAVEKVLSDSHEALANHKFEVVERMLIGRKPV